MYIELLLVAIVVVVVEIYIFVKNSDDLLEALGFS